MTKDKNDVVVMDRAEQAEPVLMIGLGRGRVGKSTVLRWAIERARNAGRDVVVADGDGRNPTLSGFYRDARRPVSGEPADVRDWLTDLLNEVAERRVSMVLDLGGGDRALEEFGRDLALVEFCQAVGISPLAVHGIGPDMDDLRHIANIEAAGHFRPERTLVAMNEALVRQGASTATAFQPLLGSPEWAALEARKVRPLLLRRLPCMADLDRKGLGFFAGAAGRPGTDGSPLGPVQRHMLAGWLRATEGELGAAAGWLP